MIHVILYQPEIPPNTGNIIRLCANTGASLSLIEPLGFQLEDKSLRRAGLDYHEFATLKVYPSLAEALKNIGNTNCYAFTTKACRAHSEVSFKENDILLFGPETKGLPAEILASIKDEHQLRLPMRAHSRSLNLSNTVAVAIYEAWRQLDFQGGQ